MSDSRQTLAEKEAGSPLQAMVRVSRRIRATPERVFDAFVSPADLLVWFGPRSVEVLEAETDPRAGGSYRIDMRRSDGAAVRLTGTYLTFERPSHLVMSWLLTGHGREGEGASQVTLRCRPDGDGTRVTIVHERLSAAAEAGITNGWEQGIAALADYIEALA